MKTLLAYYSFTGNNEALAKELHRRLGCDLLRVSEVRKRSLLSILLDLIFKRKPKIIWPVIDLGQYDVVVFAAPIWAGRIAMPLAAFIAQVKSHLKEYAFISVCTGHEAQAARIAQELRGLTGREPKAVVQLKVNDLLPPERKGKVRYASNYRVRPEDFFAFGNEIERFAHVL